MNMPKLTLKAELHAHTRFDPRDAVSYSAFELIEEAAARGYQVLSITCHNALEWSDQLNEYATERGIWLIPGIEAEVEGVHVLIYGLKRYRPPMDFHQLRALRQAHPEILVIAPHPFFPGKTCLGPKLLEHIDCFDAIEYSHFYTRQVNFNRRAYEVAKKHRKALIGTSDAHMFEQLGLASALVSLEEKTYASFVQAIRRGDVALVTQPLGWIALARIFLKMVWISSLGRARGWGFPVSPRTLQTQSED
jgi:hypothetical protein